MRRQLEADEAARHEAGGPNFSVNDGATARLSIRCDDGTGASWRRDYSCEIGRRPRAYGFHGL